jgi:CheY-like chemotaxis protein
MLAHELRNPLAPLVTGLDVLRQAPVEGPTWQQALDAVSRSTRQLTRLVDDLLEATRISHGRIQLRNDRVDLARLVRTVAEDRRSLVERAGLRLTVQSPQTPLWVLGDETRLAQCLHNLLENAVRFTDPGGSIALSAFAEQGQAVVSVADSGIGIEPATLATLFRPFSQGDRSLERKRGGLGLGLSIVKVLVEAHGGTVEAASEGPGRGATFTVRLALQPELPALAAPPTRAREVLRQSRVLVVEDNRDTADSLSLLLEILGQEVSVAYTGPEGVARAVAWVPDLVLCDIGLPGLDGFGVAAALRQHPATARARIVAVTGYGSAEDRRRAREAGFDQLLQKPVDQADLEQVLAAGS